MFFYELHEGDDEVYSDVLVVSESEWEPQEFFELVQRIRHDIQDHYEQDTLIEAIAASWSATTGSSSSATIGWLPRSTCRSRRPTTSSPTSRRTSDDEDDDDDEEDDEKLNGDFRTILAEFDPDRGRPN